MKKVLDEFTHEKLSASGTLLYTPPKKYDMGDIERALGTLWMRTLWMRTLWMRTLCMRVLENECGMIQKRGEL